MKIQKVVASAALLASLLLVTACQGTERTTPGAGSSPSGGTGTSPSGNATAELKAAALTLTTTTHRYVAKVQPATVRGAVDPAAKALTVNLVASWQGSTVTLDMTGVGTDYYVKVAGLTVGGLTPTTWYHVDGTRARSLGVLRLADLSDPVGLLVLTSGVTSVTKTGERTYRGTFDITKPAAGLTGNDLKDLGDKAKNVPFEAAVDGAGRLASLTFLVPAYRSEPATPVEITFSDFGAAVGITKPTTNVVEAPEAVYLLFNSAT